MRILMASLVFYFVNAKAQSIPANTGSNFKASDAKIFSNHHNKVRAEVGVGKLSWSSSLSNYAQSWANELAAKKCKMKHSNCVDTNGRELGENIFWGSSSAVYGTLDASTSWYEEKADYNGKPIGENRGKMVGHYTQMGWGIRVKWEQGLPIAPVAESLWWPATIPQEILLDRFRIEKTHH